MTTRAEYFIAFRLALLDLDDRTLGIFMWHCSGRFPWSSGVVPPDLTTLELHERLFPVMPPEWAQANVGGKPSTATLKRHAEVRSGPLLAVLKGPALTRYENTVLALGQCARDLIQGDSTAHWNVQEERRRQLDTEWTRLDTWATQAETSARVAREKASAVRTQLDTTLTELQRLAEIKETR